MSNDESDSPGPLSAVVGDGTLPPGIERNLWKALGRLGTSVSSALAGIVDRWDAEKQAETSSRIQIIETSASQTIKSLNVSPEYVREAANTFMARIVRRKINVDTIVQRTAEHISSTDTNDAGEISDDFLEHFGDEASKQNTDNMRDLFARILAGEIQRPGSYSIRLVRTLSELTPQIAKIFRRLCSICIAMQMKDYLHDVRASTLGILGYGLSNYALGYRELLELEEYGLIVSDVNSTMNYEDSVVYSERPHDVTLILYQNQYWRIVPENVGKSHPLMITGVALTQLGRELFTVVDQVENSTYTAALHQYFQKMKMKMVRY